MGGSWIDEAVNRATGKKQEPERRELPTVHMAITSNGAEAPDRLVTFPTIVDVGKFAIGADQYIEIGQLKVADGFVGQVMIAAQMSPPTRKSQASVVPGFMQLEPRNAFGPDTGAGYIASASLWTPLPLRARFHPKEAGRHEELLTLTFSWSDGRITRRDVLLIGNAYDPSIAQEPVPRRDVPGDLDENQVSSTESPVSAERMAALVLAFDDAAQMAATKMEKMAKQQAGGKTDAEKMAASYKLAKGDTGFWIDLAILAVTMATGGLVGAVSKLAAKAVKGRFQEKELQSFIETFMSDGVKEGMKHAIARSAKRPPKDPMPLPAPPKYSDTDPASASTAAPVVLDNYVDHTSIEQNPGIAFWSTQDDILTNLQDSGSTSLHKIKMSLAARLKDKPEGAAAAMKTIADGLTNLTNTQIAKQEQTQVSLSQWISGIHQAGMGSMTATDKQGDYVPVSDMRHETASDGTTPNGLLDLLVFVETDGPRLTHVSVLTGALMGISLEAINELSQVPFGRLRIPIRLDVKSATGAVTITRDEAGRVRCSGSKRDAVSATPVGGDPNGADLLPFAESVFAALANANLAGFNLKDRMHHNDGTELGNG